MLFSLAYPANEDCLQPGGKTLATLRVILTAAQQAASSDPLGAKHYVDRALAIIANGPGGRESFLSPHCGGLASWQMLRVKELIEQQLGGRLLTGELAAAVRVSPSHFARGFKRIMGCTPHHYILLRRIARAKELIRTNQVPLAEVALACGFSDQSHFTRSFRRCEGETPTAWHRRTTNRDPRNYCDMAMTLPN